MANGQPKKRTDSDADTPDSKPLQLQRRRVWRACESCRRKKIKCDGVEPECSGCKASGSQCTWLQTKDRAALSRHYVQELEARLLHMESLFTQIAPVLEKIGPLPDGTSIADLTSAASSSSTLPPRPVSQKERSAAVPIKAEEDDVSESFGQLALDEYGHMRWIGGSSTMSLIQSFKALTSSPLQRRISPMEEDPLAPGPSVNKLYFPASVFFGKVRALPGPEEVEWPPRDLADKLVNAYFARYHFLNPVIDKPSFLRRYNEIIINPSDPSVIQAETPFVALIFAVFACAAGLVEDSRLSANGAADAGGMGMVYYERALILQYISHASTQVTHVQCFLLLSSYLCSVNCLPQAWILVGQAVRIGQDLGLHRSPRRLTVTPIEKETRRKIWWGVYCMDRMLALALGRPLGILDADCDVELPVQIDDEFLNDYFNGAPLPQRQPSLMAGSVALASLYKIAGRVMREVYALEICKDNLEPEIKAGLQNTVETLDAELTEWCDNLPPVFKNESETEEQVSMGAVLCSHYYSVLTTLHRNLLPVKRDQPGMAKSTVKAVSSARSCIRLAPSMKHVVPPSHHLAFFIQQLFSSAVILLLYAMHSTERKAASAAMEEATSTLGALESWEGSWPGARKCKELLMELTSTAADAVAQAAHEPPPQSVSPREQERERRKSVTIATGSGSGRVTKNRTRRNQSRDPGTSSSRRLAAVSPYRVDSATRARSSSRRRGLDDGEGNDRGSKAIGGYYQSFASPTSTSPHSSPASVNVPSPVPILDKNSPQPSPTLASSSAYGYPPLSPTTATNGQFEFDYTLPPNPLHNGQQHQPQWNGSGEQQGIDLYPTGLSYSYSGFDGPDYSYEMNPELSQFAAQGLPFRGLEFIRNYGATTGNGANYEMGEQDLWHSYDPGAFQLNPDLPFTLGDVLSEEHQQQHRR
ncbi:Zn(2)-C6 fungal-type domain-containing protein [Mycena indigotica]|uniref:Zn(2)-C6 fungal-type domain-containing protein n=1 Tax=Mycena indigotica TaxID=2126181 RepID=A0A8H6SKV1_9AGAR|nr:Zn(2)-C6 fungal-type domain-containing protein [Mycena indigotica]KAF7301468.1 Zn(2)-C6 fungal-type domain-containing protein [Mycena indigotica]